VRRYAQCGVIDFKEVDDMALHIKKMTDWLGADVCIDAVGCEASGSVAQTLTGRYMKLQAGSATALHWAINSVRKGGNVSIVGVYGPTFNAVPIGNALNKGLTLRMNQASVKRHLPRLIEHIQAGRINPREIITHRVPLEEVSDAYHIFSSKLDNCIKTILIPPNANQVRQVAASTCIEKGTTWTPTTASREPTTALAPTRTVATTTIFLRHSLAPPAT
jgi:threonine dehydrogenase-like Zn-dependent dehydrogenase